MSTALWVLSAEKLFFAIGHGFLLTQLTFAGYH